MLAVTKFVFQAAVALVGSLGIYWVVEARIYALVGLLVMLTSFALIVTSRARAATSSNPDVELRPIPMGAWTLMSFALALTLGAFWPVLPIALTWKQIEKTNAAEREHVRGTERERHP